MHHHGSNYHVLPCTIRLIWMYHVPGCRLGAKPRPRSSGKEVGRCEQHQNQGSCACELSNQNYKMLSLMVICQLRTWPIILIEITDDDRTLFNWSHHQVPSKSPPPGPKTCQVTAIDSCIYYQIIFQANSWRMLFQSKWTTNLISIKFDKILLLRPQSPKNSLNEIRFHYFQ